MLQQTRVEAVTEHYARFLDLFPTVADLASASTEQVLAAWSGLGYYRRARLLHEGAAWVVSNHAGELPSDPKQLLAIPGVGLYTAGAIASIAFGVAVAAVDGNVERVVSRLFALQGNPRRTPTAGRIRERAAALLDPARPGDVNQALMDLGSRVCRPAGPLCQTATQPESACPLALGCEALDRGLTSKLPELAPRPPTVSVRLACAVVRERGLVLLVRRSERARRLAGFWELPAVELQADEPEERSVKLLSDAVRSATGVDIVLGRRVGTVRHAIVERRIRLDVYTATAHLGERVADRSATYDGSAESRLWAMHPENSLGELAVSSMDKKALALAEQT